MNIMNSDAPWIFKVNIALLYLAFIIALAAIMGVAVLIVGAVVMAILKP